MISYRELYLLTGMSFVLPKEKNFDKFDFDMQIEEQTKKKGKAKKVWEKPRFERKCK